jgi:PAS domain S-box-containing protein
MLDIIQNDYAGVVTLQRLSATIGRQPAYLGRLFRQEVGSSMREYLTRVRLERAADLIRAGVKIEAVALIVGYRSKKNFYEQFKRRYGATPAPYRHQSGIDASSGSALEHGAPREERISVCAPPQQVATAAEVPRRSSPPVEPAAATSSEPELEPVPGQVGSIIRASKEAWRLAVRTQQIMLAHFERTRVGLLLTDDRGRYIGANPAAISVTGYSVPELHRLSQAELFPEAPHRDTRCVWQFVLSIIHRHDRSPNAVVRDKAGAYTRVHLVTVKNMLWGRREISDLLGRLPAATR